MSPDALFFVFRIAAAIGVIAFVLWLLSRFVRAHERLADALETIARNLKDGTGGN